MSAVNSANCALIESFQRDGFVILRQALSHDVIVTWQSDSEEVLERCFQDLYRLGHTSFPTHSRTVMNSQEIECAMGVGVKNGFREIVMRSSGRYELSLLQDGKALEDLPDLVIIQEAFQNLVPKLLSFEHWKDLRLCNLSLVVATPGATEQSWHADGGHVNVLQHCPCHCLNIFIPLMDVTDDMGPTELRPGSHYLTRNLAPMMLAAKARKTLQSPTAPLLEMGDALIFDYRILHRGRANHSTTVRTFLVMTMAQPWFKDVLNFPSSRSLYEGELSHQQ